MEKKKVLLSVKDLDVKFRVRGRILTAIRGISLDIYENESIAIVGESGSGKSVFTKTFAGMLDTNGFISRGSVVFNDEELSDTTEKLTPAANAHIKSLHSRLNRDSVLEKGAATYREILKLKAEKKAKETLSDEDDQKLTDEMNELKFQLTEARNLKQTFDRHSETDKIKETNEKIKGFEKAIKDLEKKRADLIASHKKTLAADADYNKAFSEKMTALKAKYAEEIKGDASAVSDRNLEIAKEIYLSVGRFHPAMRVKTANKLEKGFREAMRLGEDVSQDSVRDAVYSDVTLRVKLTDETPEQLHGNCIIDVSKVKYPKDWTRIRGSKIATVFQDPMTSLNPIITIGKQITSIILKHQNCTEIEARERALKLMKQVGIPNAENRFDDYPFQYSGGMRQRIVIAIALSCQPKILICDEPTTALDVTIQAQILQLLKDLQKEYKYTIVFITHDLGVVANVADRVAVLYGGQVIELGTVEEVFYDPRHPYTWALLSSLPQLAQKGVKLYSIAGTPPSLYNRIIGDAFAPRNPYCLKVDTLEEPPMFQITETHFAKTWLLDPRAPKITKPEAIENIHEKLCKAFNI
ncbi:MAG: ATP-binding cassette domain-containing protein [Lachnospiraceae bacterium]|nr:ATP-binding cassette domain-containing protein [Lachnospiraceae bacterium]